MDDGIGLAEKILGLPDLVVSSPRCSGRGGSANRIDTDQGEVSVVFVAPGAEVR